MREFAFELAMCAAVETESDGIVARQLGTHTRVVDVVEIRPGPEFSDRIAITPEAIPPLAVESTVGVGTARYWKDAVGDTAHARGATQRAIDLGFFEAERRNGRRYVRQAVRYPDWIGDLRAFENKPDLGRPGDLEFQLRKDVSLGLFDEVVLVTESYVTGAHLNRIPPEVGVWRFDPETGNQEVVREPTSLSTDEPGIAVLDETPLRADIEPVTATEKRQLRRRIAERAYGKGWRPTELPGCVHAEARGPAFHPDDALPYCAWKGRFVDPARECGADCDGFQSADPPSADLDAVRARHSPWEPSPEEVARKQTGLDRFTRQ